MGENRVQWVPKMGNNSGYGDRMGTETQNTNSFTIRCTAAATTDFLLAISPNDPASSWTND